MRKNKMDVILALISSLMEGSGAEAAAGLGDVASQSLGDTAVGKGISAAGKEDATASSVFNAARSGMNPSGQASTQMQALPQGVVGMQQPTYTQPNYTSGIPSLLQSYGESSQGLLPFIGAR
jgi:hypothetical protein